MTVNTELSKRIYTGNGVATDYDYDFKIPLAGDLAVSLFDLDGVELPQVLNTDYTVTGAGGDNGGKVLFTVPPPNGYTILLLSDATYTQPTDFKNQGRFFPETHENAIDRAVILSRQNHEAITRSITLPPQVTNVSTQLPVPQVSTLFGWNGDGTAIENFPLSTIATQIAYGDKNYQVFTGTGAQVNFTLSQNPGSLGNLAVSIDGVVQVPVADYIYSGTTLTLTSAPTNGAVILVRFDVAVPTGTALASATNFTPTGTGTIQRSVQDKLRETRSVMDYGVIGDGITDDTANLQTAITRASAEGFKLLFPDGNYRVTGNLVQTGVIVMGALSDGRATITKTGTGDLFSGESAVISGLSFVHQGSSGRILNLTGDGARATNCNFTNAAANTSDMVHCTRSDHYFGRNYFTNNNANAYAIHVERTSSGICINGAIDDRNTFGGIGRGVRFSSSVGGARPEGWAFNNNTVILTGNRHVTVESVLHLAVAGNILDQCSGTCVDLSPNSDNIDSVSVSGNYIATAAAPTTGVGLNTQGGTGSIFNLRIENNHCENCNYGFALNPKVSEFIVAGNTFANINTESVRYAGAVCGAISGNVFRGSNVHLQLIDGSTGKAISVAGNVFPSTGSVAATFTDRTRFEFRGNVGKKFEGWCSATVALNATGGVALAVPHGLALPPNIDRIVGAVQQITGDHVNTTIKLGTVDATSVNIGVYGTVNTAGNLRANLYVSV